MSAVTLPKTFSPRLPEICAGTRLAIVRGFVAVRAWHWSGKRRAAGPERAAVAPPDWWTIDVQALDAQAMRCCSSPCSREFCYCLACA